MHSTDLSNCDREPIHIPGKIQSHGFLLAVDNKNFTITYASQNIVDHLGETANNLLSKPIKSFVDLFFSSIINCIKLVSAKLLVLKFSIPA